MFSEALLSQAKAVLEAARGAGLRVATAESCTGGLIAALLTEIAGSSDVFERGFVTYSNLSKQELLGVPETLLVRHGAVSKEVAGAMAEGALRRSQAMISVAVTGIAGPGGGSSEKPVGLVYIAAARRDADTLVEEFRLGDPGRAAIRRRTVAQALALLLRRI